MEKTKKKPFFLKVFIILFISLILGTVLYFGINSTDIRIPEEIYFIKIPTDSSTSADVANLLETVGGVLSLSSISLVLCLLIVGLRASNSMSSGTPKSLKDPKYDVNSDQKGSARWLTDQEIDSAFQKVTYEEAKNYDINGFVVQTKRIRGKTYANFRGDYHCLVIGTTGSGKTIRFVIPTMQLLARSRIHPSIVCTDPKAELYTNQSKLFKKMGYNIISINLREPLKKSSCWNPCRMAYVEYQEAVNQKEKIIRHIDKLENYTSKLELARPRGEFKSAWYELNGYAFSNINDAMIEAERNSKTLKAKAQESISDLVDTIYAESLRKASDPYWVKSGKSITQGLLLSLLEDSEIKDLGIDEHKFNLSTVSTLLSLRADLLKSYFDLRDAASNAKRIAMSAVSAPEGGTRESIISSALADLTPFADPDIQYIICNNDIDFKDIGRKPTVVFLIIPDEKENRHVFASLFITQAYKALVELAVSSPGGKCPHCINFIIDEFANMPVIPGMDNKITVARSRGINFMLIIQALSQLNAKYTQDIAKIISTNCNMQVFLGSNDTETAEYFSKMCGEKTTREKNVQINSQNGDENYSFSLSSRALIKPEELLTLPEGHAIVKLFRTQPAKLRQVEFWKDPNYYKGEQEIDIPWNPTIFNFETDAYYDILNRCENDVMYKINSLQPYQLNNQVENKDDDGDETTTTTSTSTTDDDTSFSNMESIDVNKTSDFDEWLNSNDLNWDNLFKDNDTTKPTEELATTADIVNASLSHEDIQTKENTVEDISTLNDWLNLFESNRAL